MEVAPEDYLQVFKLSVEDGKQRIVHSQEQPEYSHTYLVDSDEAIAVSIFIIDDGDHSTMLLSSEY